MKTTKSVIILLIIILTILPWNSQVAKAYGDDINIDGYNDDWSAIPYSWEYPNDNDYPDGQNYYDINSRHQMSLYTDGEYAYLHIELSTKEKSGLNGENFQFWGDDIKTVFELSYVGGEKINKNEPGREPGIYALEVRHQGGNLNNTVVLGAEATYTIKDNNENNELELKLPLSAMADQDNSIVPEDIRQIAFFCPYLMYRRIICSGVSTSPYLGIVLCVIFAGGAAYLNKRKVRSTASKLQGGLE